MIFLNVFLSRKCAMCKGKQKRFIALKIRKIYKRAKRRAIVFEDLQFYQWSPVKVFFERTVERTKCTYESRLPSLFYGEFYGIFNR